MCCGVHARACHSRHKRTTLTSARFPPACHPIVCMLASCFFVVDLQAHSFSLSLRGVLHSSGSKKETNQSSSFFESPAATPKQAASGLSCCSGLDTAKSKQGRRQNSAKLFPLRSPGMRQRSPRTRCHCRPEAPVARNSPRGIFSTLQILAKSRTRGHCGPEVSRRCW